MKPLFYVNVQPREIGSTKLEISVEMKALFKSKTTAEDVELYIPIPPDAFNPDFTCEIGEVSYFPDDNAIIWQIPSFVGEQEMTMKSRMQLPTVVSGTKLSG